MKKIPPFSDQAKIALLSVGVLGVFGNVYIRFNQAQAPTPAQVEELGSEHSTMGVDPSTAKKPDESILSFAANTGLPTVDIFRKVLPDDTGRRVLTPAPPSYLQRAADSSATQRFAAMPRPEIAGSLAPLPLAGPGETSAASQPASTAPAAPELPQVRLTGIITGDSPVAMLNFAGKNYVARAGQAFAPGAKILRIGERSAELEVVGQKLTLKL